MHSFDARRPRKGAIDIAQFLAPSAYIALAMTLGTIGPALAQEADGGGGSYVQERFAFDVADTDGKGLISEAEFVRDAAAAFSRLDKDGSETLTPDELGPHDPAAFARVDADGDGVLTFEEVMRYKMRAFEAADTDG